MSVLVGEMDCFVETSGRFSSPQPARGKMAIMPSSIPIRRVLCMRFTPGFKNQQVMCQALLQTGHGTCLCLWWYCCMEPRMSFHATQTAELTWVMFAGAAVIFVLVLGTLGFEIGRASCRERVCQYV